MCYLLNPRVYEVASVSIVNIKVDFILIYLVKLHDGFPVALHPISLLVVGLLLVQYLFGDPLGLESWTGGRLERSGAELL
jgi:hypothetical protein